MRGWAAERARRQALAQAKAAGGQLIGEKKIVAGLRVVLFSDGTAQVAMPPNMDVQFALIGRALTAAVLGQGDILKDAGEKKETPADEENTEEATGDAPV